MVSGGSFVVMRRVGPHTKNARLINIKVDTFSMSGFPRPSYFCFWCVWGLSSEPSAGRGGKGYERTKGVRRRDVRRDKRCPDKEDCLLKLGRCIRRGILLEDSIFFHFSSPAKRTNNANNATHYVKLGKKRRESSKRNYYIISPEVIIKAIIIIRMDWADACSLG